MRIDQDLTAAPAAPLVLAILSEGESYGYAIFKQVRELSEGEFEWADAMIYPLFHRLHRLGYLTSEWRALPEGRRRRYYAMTDDGRAALAKQQRRWVTALRALGGMGRGPGALLTALGTVTDRVESSSGSWRAMGSTEPPPFGPSSRLAGEGGRRRRRRLAGCRRRGGDPSRSVAGYGRRWRGCPAGRPLPWSCGTSASATPRSRPLSILPRQRGRHCATRRVRSA